MPNFLSAGTATTLAWILMAGQSIVAPVKEGRRTPCGRINGDQAPAVSKGADIILQDRGRAWVICTGTQDLQQTTYPDCLLLVQHHGPPYLLTELAHKVAAACPHYHGMQNPGKQVCSSLHAGRAVHCHMTSHN